MNIEDTIYQPETESNQTYNNQLQNETNIRNRYTFDDKKKRYKTKHDRKRRRRRKLTLNQKKLI